MIFYLLFFLIIFIILVYRSFQNAEAIICKPPNEFVHIFSPPGTGKTTYAAKIVRDNIVMKLNEDNKPVYSNVPIIGAIQLHNVKDLGKYLYQDCVIVLDEAGTELSNRNWHNNLDLATIDFIKKHRHYNVDIYVFSQSHGDVDNKFRELTTKILMLQRTWIPFQIHAHAIRKKMDLIGGAIVEYYEWWEEQSFKFFNPNLWAYFNSYDIDKNKKEQQEKKYYTKLDLD